MGRAAVTPIAERVRIAAEERPQFLAAGLHLLCEDEVFLRETAPLLDVRDWSDFPTRWLMATVVEHLNARDDAPGLAVIEMRVEADESCTDEQRARLRDLLDELGAVRLDERVRDHVKNEFAKEARKRVVARALREAEAAAHAGELDDIPRIMSRARQLITKDTGWVFLPRDFDLYFKSMARLQASAIPLGIAQIDEVLNGGIRAGELGVLLGALGFGKSMALVHIGSEAVRSGHRVMHVSFENSAQETIGRYIRNLTDLTHGELGLMSPQDEVFQERLRAAFLRGGSVSITHMNGAQTSAHDLIGMVKALPKAERPSMMLIDYGDLMVSGQDGWRELSRQEEVGMVFGELRELAKHLDIAVWTATQLNRDGVSKGRALMEHVSTNLGKLFCADIVIGISPANVRAPQFVGMGEADATCRRVMLRIEKSRRGRDKVGVELVAAFDRAKFILAEEEDDDLF
jgi:archaellum biogenesis ATPase FlaH